MVLNCPHCSGVIFKTDEDDVRSFSMKMKCPHCKNDIRVELRQHIVVMLNGRTVEAKQEPKLRSM